MSNGAGKDRITDNDKAIIDIKGRMRKLKTYEKKLAQQDQEATDKIKELLKAGQKERALVHLRKKKFIEAEVNKMNGATIQLQQTLLSIESAAADLDIFTALKEGDAVLKDLHAKVSIQDWEELYESHQENMEVRQMEIDLFGAELQEEDLAAELDQLVAEDAMKDMELPAVGAISQSDAQQFREEHGISQPAQAQAQQPEPTRAAPERQLIGA